MRIELWDGSAIGPLHGTGVLRVRSPARSAPPPLGPRRARAVTRLRDGRPRRGRRRASRCSPTLRDAVDPRPAALALSTGAPRAGRRPRHGRARVAPPRRPPEEARPRGRRHSSSGMPTSSATTTTSGNDFYRLVLGPSMTYSCARFEHAGRRPRGGPGGQARAGRPQAGPGRAPRRPPARRRVRLGLAGDPRRQHHVRPVVGHHHQPRAGGPGRVERVRGRRRRRTGSRSASRTTATSTTSPSTPSPRSACSSTSARARMAEYFSVLHGRAPSRRAASSTTPSPGWASPGSGAVPSPAATCSPTASSSTSGG